ncbi:MAG TPA: isochorismatase family protein, partial [Terriglobales bacterium]|nr:isochorismatase family protein [Terriglobales bacterium]
MAIDLAQRLAPKRCALLIMECQEGVIGAAGLGALPEAVSRHGIVPRIAALADAARRVQVPVFYLNAARRADHLGTGNNCLLFALGRKSEPLVPGSPRQAVVAELAPQP